MIFGNIVEDPRPVMLDNRLDLLAGAGVDDCIGPVLCQPFHDRVIREIEGGDQEERRDLLAIEVPQEFFLVGYLCFELFEIRRGGYDLCEPYEIIRVDKQEIEFCQVLPVSPDGDVAIF